MGDAHAAYNYAADVYTSNALQHAECFNRAAATARAFRTAAALPGSPSRSSSRAHNRSLNARHFVPQDKSKAVEPVSSGEFRNKEIGKECNTTVHTLEGKTDKHQSFRPQLP